jgi:hypothetical protein
MSKAVGEVWYLDGEFLGNFIYDGTTDSVIPGIYATGDEAWDGWENYGYISYPCDPKHVAEPVIIYSSYGGGFWWRGTMCLDCLCLLPPLDNFEGRHATDGHPGEAFGWVK